MWHWRGDILYSLTQILLWFSGRNCYYWYNHHCLFNPHNVPFMHNVIQPSGLATRSILMGNLICDVINSLDIITWCKIQNQVWLEFCYCTPYFWRHSNNDSDKKFVEKTKYQFSSVGQSCPTLCDPMNCSTPGFPVHHQLPEFTQTHVHPVGDAIKPSHPRSSPSPPAPNPSQHQSLFQWVSSSHELPKYWSFSFSISPSKEHLGLISFRMDWLDLIDYLP